MIGRKNAFSASFALIVFVLDFDLGVVCRLSAYFRGNFDSNRYRTAVFLDFGSESLPFKRTSGLFSGNLLLILPLETTAGLIPSLVLAQLLFGDLSQSVYVRGHYAPRNRAKKSVRCQRLILGVED